MRAANPDVIYSFASGFGETGPRAPLPANDHLMQALSGVEAAQGGYGPAADLPGLGRDRRRRRLDVRGRHDRRPVRPAPTAVPASRSRPACSARRCLMRSGAFLAGDEVVGGPVLDADQTGYGAAYRLYQCADDAWFALAVPDGAAWGRLRALVGVDGLPVEPPPLRTRGGEPQPAEAQLERVFRSRPAAAGSPRCAEPGVPVELVARRGSLLVHRRFRGRPGQPPARTGGPLRVG